tara:strand:- start:8105 stop:8638 length:534 start_codon:yes stop_codon:yes gene_type:complete
MEDESLQIRNKTIAMLIENHFGDEELRRPLEGLRAAGATVEIVGPTAPTEYTGMEGMKVLSTLAARTAKADQFDAIVIPGGWAPDRIRMRHLLVDLVREAVAQGKPVATICRGAQVLISAKSVKDRMVTCWPSIAVDVKNAGGLYVDRPVVVDGPLITSRKVDDVPEFTNAIISALS